MVRGIAMVNRGFVVCGAVTTISPSVLLPESSLTQASIGPPAALTADNTVRVHRAEEPPPIEANRTSPAAMGSVWLTEPWKPWPSNTHTLLTIATLPGAPVATMSNSNLAGLGVVVVVTAVVVAAVVVVVLVVVVLVVGDVDVVVTDVVGGAVVEVWDGATGTVVLAAAGTACAAVV
jgi:hypothetical protein